MKISHRDYNTRSVAHVLLWVVVLAMVFGAWYMVYVADANAQITPTEDSLQIRYIPPDEIVWVLESTNDDEIITVNPITNTTWDFKITPNPTKLSTDEIINYPFELYRIAYTGTGPDATKYKVPVSTNDYIIQTIPTDIKTTLPKIVTSDGQLDLTKNSGFTLYADPIDIAGSYLKVSVHSATYSAISNIIEITGNSTQMRADIYAAGVIQGWAGPALGGSIVYTRCGSYCYNTSARIDIGDGVTATNVYDEYGSLCFNDQYGATSWNIFMYIHNNATATFGNVIDIDTRTTNKGISFLIDENAAINTFKGDGATAKLYLNSCTFEGANTIGTNVDYLWHIDTGHLWNCIFKDSFGTHSLGTNEFEVYNTQFHNPVYPFINLLDYDNILSAYSSNAVSPIMEALQGSYYNITSINNDTYEVYSSSNTGLINLYNCDVLDRHWNNWRIRWLGVNTDPILRYYSLNLTVTDNGTPIQAATVTIETNNGTPVATLYTSASGTIPMQWLELGRYPVDSGTINLRTPHTITVSAVGYQTYIDNIFMSEEKILQIALTPVSTGTTAGDVLSWSRANLITMSWWEENMDLIVQIALIAVLAFLACWRNSMLLYITAASGIGFIGAEWWDTKSFEWGGPVVLLAVVLFIRGIWLPISGRFSMG